MSNDKINAALLRLAKRAETSEPRVLVDTFVDTGLLENLLTSKDHQVIYGRRGTGKTHALLYVSETKRTAGDISLYIDMRNIGSSVGLFADKTIPLAERSTRLLRDTFATIHDRLLTLAIENSDTLNLGEIGGHLDAFIDAATETQVVGVTDTEESSEKEASRAQGITTGLNITTHPAAGASLAAQEKSAVIDSTRTRMRRTGSIQHRVRFGAIGQTLGKIVKSISPRRIWLLLDEWSAVPIELQPYLADLIRRSILPVQGISVKIAAIEQRSAFQIAGEHGDYIGMELGADIAADLNLDDFMVFDNNAARAVIFFRKLIFNHFKSVQGEVSPPPNIADEREFIRRAFTQRPAFEEIVRAAEGVPRDAINVLALCAQKAATSSISVNHARAAAKLWYERDKESSVSANPNAETLLRWIVGEVIAARKARAFLLDSKVRDPLIDSLFDSRVLHVLKRNISSRDDPGARYDAYKIDYGCYVNLITTQLEPKGLLPAGDTDGCFVDVPPDDYRAIRRAILDLPAFYSSIRT